MLLRKTSVIIDITVRFPTRIEAILYCRFSASGDVETKTKLGLVGFTQYWEIHCSPRQKIKDDLGYKYFQSRTQIENSFIL
jgi:hypothetical protein